MSGSFGVPPVPPMTAEKARDLARDYKGFANHLREQGLAAEARYNEQQSQWWLAWAIAVAQAPKGDE